MELWKIALGIILPYVAVVAFVAGMVYRVQVWRKLPSPPMTLFPAPKDSGANAWNTLREAFFFRSLFKGDRLLWVFAWSFHAVLALILLGHIRVFTGADRVLLGLGMNAEQIQAMSGGVGGAAGALILVMAIILLIRRLVVQRAREVTGLGDCLALLLIGAVIVTGNMMRLSAEHFDLSLARDYFADLAAFRDVTGEAVLENNAFLAHMSLAFLLIMCIPFSKILHFGGVFFTHQMIRKH